MKRLLLLCGALRASATKGKDEPPLVARQVDGAISEGTYFRRGYHSSAVLNGRVYIDGGEVSFSNSSETGGVEYQYSDSLLYIDITTDFSPSSVTVASVAKPSGVSNLIQGGLWVDQDADAVYTGFAGSASAFGDGAEQPQGLWSFQPGSDGTNGTWTNLNDTTDSFFASEKRPFGAAVASGNGTAFLLGGLDVFGSYHVPISGLLSYDFDTQTVTNTSVSASTDGFLQMGSIQYVPNFGSAGILVAAGGNHAYVTSSGEWASNWQAFDTVQVLDIASGEWYDQVTTGSVPPFRMQYCMAGAASSNRTYEILVYAGWNNTLGERAVSYDAAYVLSLPSFNWFKADYEAANPRHALTCEHIGGGQVLTIGGLDTSQNDAANQYRGVFHTKDDFPQGLGVFDLSSLSFATSFEANRTTYEYATALRTYYQTRDRVSSSMGDALQAVFSVENFTSSATAVSGSSSGSAGTSGGSTSSSSGGDSGSGTTSSSNTGTSRTGAIAGGVIGGIAGVALVGAAVFYFLRRRREGQDYQGKGVVSVNDGKTYQLSDGSEPFVQRYQVAGDPEAAEVPGSKPPGYNLGGRAELA
ncbi:kelch repeat protein [Diaporthe amygdali]|uniref:kelch repeat protein n=1 Tax=Phomopsis amygdali TaxID=1214568 RepID=UPI0022FE219C|nr:kelch repeat protein [Diaporthe amygdali]KAJ0103853.1 kelch repeat protein [Diaporthe amygdali]